MPKRSGSTRRTYRLAVSATGEFTAFAGGTVTLGLNAVATIVNRVNGIYEQELSARLVLVASNNLLINTNAATDPFTNPGPNNTTLVQNQNSTDSRIGSSAYDVGHVVHAAANTGFVSTIGNACGTTKARGMSASDPPVGDPFAVDYVAHEIGHQFGMRHGYNNCNGNQGDISTLAVEPGSGSTIMCYAGICALTNLQLRSDPYFHSVNFDQFQLFQIGGGACQAPLDTGNNPPTVSAGPDYTIPKGTPFTLVASGSDADVGDVLTYCWETRDGGNPVALNTDDGSSPIMRSWPPVSSASRTLPRLDLLLANLFALGETLPTQPRIMNWRVTARDNRAGSGGVATDDMVLSVASSGPFRVTSPNTAVTWTGTQTITWDVAGTNLAPVSCTSVRILLSTDGGMTFPIVLNAGTPNDGSQSVKLPQLISTRARVRVEPVGNIFFDVSDADFNLVLNASGVALVGSGLVQSSDALAPGNANGVLEPRENNVRVWLGVINGGPATATSVSGTLVSLTPNVSVTSAGSLYPDLPLGVSAKNATPYVIALGAGHPCGAPINLRLDLAHSQGASSALFSLPTGTEVPQVFTKSYSGPALVIPDNTLGGVSATLDVAGVGTIVDLNIRFDGSACSSMAGSTTVGLSHTYIADLTITLRSPAGTTVSLMQNNGEGGNNLCGTLLDDDGGFPPFASANITQAPYTGTFAPLSPLSAFDGQNANGTWTLKVVDGSSGDSGNIRAFSLIITAPSVYSCQAPLALPPCPGDASGDRVVNFADITAVLLVFGQVGQAYGLGDADGNASVNFADITSVLLHFGNPCP